MSGPLTDTADHVVALFRGLTARGAAPVLVVGARDVSACEVLDDAERWENELRAAGVGAGAVCAFVGDFSPATVSLLLALMRLGAVAVPFTQKLSSEQQRLARIAAVEWWINPGSGQTVTASPDREENGHPLITALKAAGHPGLVVFTSGSTGTPKAILHDIDRVASKFARPRRGWRTLLFLLMDHFGGFNTLLSCLAHGGAGICLADRSPEGVCRAIIEGRADLLPTTPTFLSMLIASGIWRSYDLSSVKLVTYGAEPMPEATLKRLPDVFPNAELKQTYGLSELGVLRSASPDQSSLWLKIGGEGFETRIVDGLLQVRSRFGMMGYLNAPSPMDFDGWMSTGDLVEEKDGLIRFLGRCSEIINVGGQKVFPTEVEAILLCAANVAEATVHGVRHPLLGEVVCARVSLIAPEESKAAIERLRAHCQQHLQKFKCPMRFDIVDLASQATDRAKKRRLRTGQDSVD